MQTSILHSRDPLNDYRLIIDTPQAVHKKIAFFKTAFDHEYKGLMIAEGNPFIYLAVFSQHESKELQTSDAMNRIAMGFMPFKIHLKGFGHIENNEIFINVSVQETVLLLVNQLKTMEKYMLDARFNNHPRITIAQRLLPLQFDKNWMEFSRKHFSATFLADQMLLLKRMEGFRNWQVLKRLPFQNQFVV
jgi:hypothetical protein